MFDKNPEEHFIKEGDPNKPTYYIIRRLDEATDISDMFLLVMGHVRRALSKGWLPVVDMQNYPNLYLSPEKIGQENSWEYFFEQPFRVGLEQAYAGENVVLSDADAVKPSPDCSMNLLSKKNDDLVEWRMLLKLGLMKINFELLKEFSVMREKFFAPGDIVLGVLLRGGDSKKIKGQPIAPPAEFAANAVNEKFKEWGCEKILLATDDQNVTETFKNNFGDKCVSLDQVYTVCYDTDAENNFFLQGKRHLAQTVLLAGCDSFMAERRADTTITMLSAKKFKHSLFFNLGNY